MSKPSPTPQRRCPFLDCPSHADPRARGIVRHGRMRSRTGSRRRFLCRACGRTFCGRRGSAYYRLQTPRKTFDRFAELLSEGLSCASLAPVLGGLTAPSALERPVDLAGLRRVERRTRGAAAEYRRVAVARDAPPLGPRARRTQSWTYWPRLWLWPAATSTQL
jgi:hypothetical protein